MSVFHCPPTALTTPAQVWERLAADRRHRAVCCMAQLAVNLALAKTRRTVSEVTDEQRDFHPQTANRAS